MLVAMQSFRSRRSDIGRARARYLASLFGRELRLARMAAGLTQTQVGRIAGIGQMQVSRASRQRLAPFAQLIAQTMPATTREIWRAIRTGEPLHGDGILFVRAPRRPPARIGDHLCDLSLRDLRRA